MNNQQDLAKEESSKQQIDSSTPLSTQIGVKKYSSRKIGVTKLSKRDKIIYIGFSLFILFSIIRWLFYLLK